MQMSRICIRFYFGNGIFASKITK